MKKRFVALLTTALLTVTTLASAMTVGAKDIKDFTDVNTADWFYSYVEDIAARGIMTGLNETQFGTYEDLGRGQFATMLYRMAEPSDIVFESKFNDVPDGEFYSIPVTWASNLQIVTGYTPRAFGPADEITREQLATMLFRYAQACELNTDARADLSKFPDEKFVSDFSRDAVEWSVGVGIISGNGDGTLAPQDRVNRAVCATMVDRFIEKYPAPETPDVPAAPVQDNYVAETYIVGTEIPAGEYVLIADGDQPGTAKLASEAGVTEDLIVDCEFSYTCIVTVTDGQEFSFDGCTAYPMGKEGKLDTTRAGMYKVGTHIDAGKYTIKATGEGYYEVMPDSSHDSSKAINKGDIIDGKTVTITVQDGQYLEIINAEFVE